MGDRIQIQFRATQSGGLRLGFKPDQPVPAELSLVLYSHWGGIDQAVHALQYATELKREQAEKGNSFMMPLDRRELDVLILDYLRTVFDSYRLSGNRIDSGLRLYAEVGDTMGLDNGHVIIDLDAEGEEMLDTGGDERVRREVLRRFNELARTVK